MNQNNNQRHNKQRQNRPLINGLVAQRFPEVRLISSDGEQLGIVNSHEAVKQAQAEDLDLVVIGVQQDPPVAKILNYGKYKFSLNKQEKENRKKSKSQSSFKEVQLTPRIDIHDLEIKVRKTIEWLQEGHKIRIVIRMKGREVQHPIIAREVLQQVLQRVQGVGKPESNPPIREEGRSMSMNLVPC